MHLFIQWGPRVARFVLGLIFFVFGLNFFLGFLGPMPPPPERAAPFFTGLISSGYIFPIIKSIEVGAGIALLANRFVPLALTLLAPLIVNIAAVHFVLSPSYPMPILLLSLEFYLAWSYRAAFAPMLRARVAPAGTAEEASAVHAPGTSTNLKSA